MSTDFQGADEKLKQIVLKAKDSDPDLRFMALNDLNKLLNEHQLIINKVNSYSSKITKILLESLKDSNSDVQNEALKCLKPLVASLDDDEILSTLRSLNSDDQNKNTPLDSITTSIQTMAIAEIIKNLNIKQISTGERISECLLPNLLPTNEFIIKSLDSIEILTDLVKKLGSNLSKAQKFHIYSSLISSIFEGENIISKKSIITLGLLSNSIDKDEFNDILLRISTYKSIDDYKVKNLILSTFISISKLNNSFFIEGLSDFIKFATDHLYLDQDNDIDDDQSTIDDVRFNALQFIENLATCSPVFINYIDEIIIIIKKFLVYDPYTNTFSDDDEDDDMSQDGFSDADESYDDLEDEIDDNTWRLRKESAKLISILLKEYPTLISQIFDSGIFNLLIDSISDSSETASFEKIYALEIITTITLKQLGGKRSSRKRRGSNDVVMIDTSDDSLSKLNKSRNKIVTKFIKEFSKIKQTNSNKYNVYLSFFQSFNRLDEDLKPLLSCVRKHNIGLNSDLLKFYGSVLSNNDLQYFGDEINYIIEIINDGLTSKNHNNILNSITTSVDLLNLVYNGKLINSIIDIAFSNNNDSELRSLAILQLGSLTTLPTDELNKILSLFLTTLKFEPLCLTTIQSISKLVELYHKSIDVNQINEIISIYTNLLKDDNYCSDTIESLNVIVQYFKINQNSIESILLKIFDENLYQSQVLKILAHLEFNETTLNEIFSKAIAIEDIDDDSLIEISRKIGSSLIPFLESDALNNNKNIKILSDLVLYLGLNDYVSARENELTNKKNIEFNLKFLGYIGMFKELAVVKFEVFESFFNDEEYKKVSANSLGKFISRNLNEYLPTLLSKFNQIGGNYNYIELYLISINEILKINNNLKFEDYDMFWKSIIAKLTTLKEIDEPICKISAENLGLILIENNDTNIFYNKCDELISDENGTQNESITYTIISSIKFILAYDNIISIELIETILNKVFNKIPNENLKIKQVSILTLMTVLNNQFEILLPSLKDILPIIYNELPKKKMYEEIISIGPFKHKVDKAIEIRKTSFEILYKLSLNRFNNITNVSFEELLDKVIQYGLNNDVISISSLIITKLLETDSNLITSSKRVVLIEGIDKLINKIQKKEDQQKDSKEEQETKNTLVNLRKAVLTL